MCIFHAVQALGVNLNVALCSAHGPWDTLFGISRSLEVSWPCSSWRCVARPHREMLTMRARLGLPQRHSHAGLEQPSGFIQAQVGMWPNYCASQHIGTITRPSFLLSSQQDNSAEPLRAGRPVLVTCLSWLAIVQLLTVSVNGYGFEVLFRKKPSFLILVSLSTITCLELSPSLGRGWQHSGHKVCGLDCHLRSSEVFDAIHVDWGQRRGWNQRTHLD